MATYNSDQIIANGGLTSLQAQKVFSGPASSGGHVDLFFSVSITAAAANLDAFNFGVVPKGFRLLGATLEATDIDTDGSPTVTINVGDSGDADRIFAASTVGQTGTLSSAIATTGNGYQYTGDTLITGAIPTGPATGATGTLYLTLTGRFEGLPS